MNKHNSIITPHRAVRLQYFAFYQTPNKGHSYQINFAHVSHGNMY